MTATPMAPQYWLLSLPVEKLKLRKSNSKKRNCRQNALATHNLAIQDVASLGQDQLSSEEPTPDEAVLLKEEVSMRINSLEDATLKSIALAKMAGHDNQQYPLIPNTIFCKL